MRTSVTVTALAGLIAASVGLGLAAQQKPAATAAKPSVTVYKSPT